MTQEYHNTTGVTGEELKSYKESASMQQSIILDFFKAHPDRQLSREDLRFLFIKPILTTSIVRCLCNLRDAGEISIVGKTKGTCGRPIFVYQKAKKL